MPDSHVTAWPNSRPGAATEWIDFITTIEDLEQPVRYQLNVSWLMSRWACQYGDCPGILVHGAMTDVACCQIGVEFTNDADYQRVRAAVKQLTAEDADEIKEIQRGRWYTKEVPEGKKTPRPLGTRVLDHGCIFANRSDGPAGKPGCALHHLAERTGQKKFDTKPDICWQIPMSVTWGWDDGAHCYWIRVDGSTGSLWGMPSNENPESLGYWCTETPDAYVGAQPVYLSMAEELIQILGEDGYAPIKERMGQLHGSARKVKMPGELVNGGRKMLPLLVMDRYRQWTDQALAYPEGPGAKEASDAAFEKMERSQDYLTKTRSGRSAANLLRSTPRG